MKFEMQMIMAIQFNILLTISNVQTSSTRIEALVYWAFAFIIDLDY